MAHPINTVITHQVVQMQKSNGTTSPYLSDQLTAEFGQARRSHIMRTIGYNNESYEELYLPYIESL